MSIVRLEIDGEGRVLVPNFAECRVLSVCQIGDSLIIEIAAVEGSRFRFRLAGLRRLHYQTFDVRNLIEGLYIGRIDRIFTTNEPLSLRLAEILSPSSDEHIGDADGMVFYASPLINCEMAAHFETLTVETSDREATE